MNRLLNAVLILLLFCCPRAQAESPEDPLTYLVDLGAYDYLESVNDAGSPVPGQYLVPLGAIQKIRGVWAPRDQERVRGERQAFTWRVLYGFTSLEVLQEFEQRLAADEGATVLFSCDARSCGASVQWANRIFRQRLLYGREDWQRYRALSIVRDGREYRLLVYASARSTDRQYLHAELMALDTTPQ